LIFVSYVPYVGFALGSFLFVTYLRKLAALADAGRSAAAELARLQEQERTRRVLHTPHRLLQELQDELRSQLADVGPDPQRNTTYLSRAGSRGAVTWDFSLV
jgi:hypothetical protein